MIFCFSGWRNAEVHKGEVLRWMTLFLTDQTQQVVYNGMSSVVQWVCYSILQGSDLGSLLFILYTADLSTVVASHGLTLHYYADDCQLYLSVPVADTQSATD